MIPAERILHWPTHILPSDLGAAIIAGGAVLAVLVGSLRARADVLRCLPGALYLLVGAATVHSWRELSAAMTGVAGVVAVAALLLHFRYFARPTTAGAFPPLARAPAGTYQPSIEDPFRAAPPRPPRPLSLSRPPRRETFGRLALSLLVVAMSAVLLFDDLNDYAGTLIGWESPVVQNGFAPVFADNLGFDRFLGERFLWDDGVLSAGHTSLFFGPPAYLLLERLGAQPAVLRLAAVLATLLSIALLYALTRRHYGRGAAAAATAFFALSTPVIFYGRYGSSIAGTILAVLLAFAAAWSFLESGRYALLRAGACALALFIATLQYSPARLAVLFLLAAIPLTLLAEYRRSRWSQWIGVALIGVLAWQAWSFQVAHGRQHYFLHARGEQVFAFFRNPESIAALVGTERQYGRDEMTRETKLELLRTVTAKTLRELVGLVSPDPEPRSRGAVVIFDPPPMGLYFAPLAVVLLFGLARSLAAWRSWRHLQPVLFALAFCAVLLLTNRVDPHRTSLLLIPLAIWFGLGAEEIGRLAARLRLPATVLWVLAFSLAAAACYSDIIIRYGGTPRFARSVAALGEEIDAIRGPVHVWVARDHRELSWLGLRILDKQLRTGKFSGAVLAPAVSDGLRQDRGGPTGQAVRQAARLARQGTLILGPRAMFVETAQRLQGQGLRVSDRDAAGFAYFRIDGGARITGVPDSELRASPLPAPRPQTPQRQLSEGVRVYLSTLEPTAVEYGFAAPRMNATWLGARVIMGGVEFDHAIGTHAWTRIRFAVPEDAFLLQAVVGLSDEMRACETASVEFEVRGDDDVLLWQSWKIDPLTPPQPMEILIAGHSQVTLITGEAGDGRDCDHANWGRAAFVLRDATVASPPGG